MFLVICVLLRVYVDALLALSHFYARIDSSVCLSVRSFVSLALSLQMPAGAPQRSFGPRAGAGAAAAAAEGGGGGADASTADTPRKNIKFSGKRKRLAGGGGGGSRY